ncbi:hypothetical protein DU19_0976 [Chlamydia muridarum]|nr:hypothetical protein DU17_0978 [Chlamydia muridarum]KDU81916.1 hypothetical protein DU18_0976 [Chlamydia muridarum]KDU82041.1 hypothetical protein DU19_0976 [Chlamydia muridarum]KDU83871.1 hypothetical protein DU20_0976 [Chlamydia muridarum]KDU84356.1 hypothetical protein DU21_0978 [Chlamydia muridarum]
MKDVHAHRLSPYSPRNQSFSIKNHEGKAPFRGKNFYKRATT